MDYNNFNNNNQQQYYQQFGIQQPQPAPIGSLLNNNTGYRGYIGYGPGVYNGYYGNRFVNPYQIAQQQQSYFNQMKEQQEAQIKLIERIMKCSLKTVYPDMDDEQYEKMCKQAEQNKKDMRKREIAQNEYDQLRNLAENRERYQSVDMEFYRMSEGIAATREYNKQHLDENTDLLTFLNNSSYLTKDLEEEERRKRFKQSNINKLYNGNQYNQLINMHSNNSNYFFNALSAAQATDIDDNSVVLPDSIRYSENAKRREQFLQAIMNK